MKKAEAVEKSIHKLKGEFAYLGVREKRNNSFEITVIILRYIGNVNLLFKKVLKLQNFLLKYPFSFILEAVLKMTKEVNKGGVESICARVTKHASKKVAKAEINLN